MLRYINTAPCYYYYYYYFLSSRFCLVTQRSRFVVPLALFLGLLLFSPYRIVFRVDAKDSQLKRYVLIRKLN